MHGRGWAYFEWKCAEVLEEVTLLDEYMTMDTEGELDRVADFDGEVTWLLHSREEANICEY